jgi:hypothetical protein
MRALTPVELLAVWEQGLSAPPGEQALSLLAAACPDLGWEELERLPIGLRDGLLLTLRELTFGARLASVMPCPACGERLEMAFGAAEIRAAPPRRVPTEGVMDTRSPENLVVTQDGYRVEFRLPDSRDVAAVSEPDDREEAGAQLLDRCLLVVSRDGVAVPTRALPAAVAQAVTERMAEADPQAEVQLTLVCPTCGHSWQTLFDILTFFWAEINAWALRALREVHILAAAYGWCEAEILALSPRRRQIYLELIAG